jgi:hypothetical protein
VTVPERKPSLEERFARFIESLPNTETIDKLQLPSDPSRRRKADFLLGNREVIVELKTLTDDTSHKVDAVADKNREREDFPVFYGKADVRKVLSHLSDGEEVYRRMVWSLTRSVEDCVRSAEEQITHTRSVMGLPHAAGVLVILNESVRILDPGLVGHRVAQLMRRERTGKSDAEKVDFVWLLFESHALGRLNGIPATTSMLIRGDRAESLPWFTAFHRDIVTRWASASNGVTIDAGSPDPSTLRFQATEDLVRAPPTELPLHELWRHQYRGQPYLRALCDDEVLARGAKVLKRLLPHFLKDGPGYLPERDNRLMEEFTHFLEEAGFRALDLRSIPKFDIPH